MIASPVIYVCRSLHVMMYAATNLLGFIYAPRIKNLKDQHIYSFKNKKEYKNLNYKILPIDYICEETIKENWDDILRFITTIKLKVTTASTLFKRLNSYSKKNPIYKGLKEYGKIIKTISILKYVDNVERRQSIEKQLNKIESAHKLKKAIAFGGEFTQAEKEDLDIAENCRLLIANAIICWNYIYLSQKITEEKDESKRNKMFEVIKNGSIVTWRHINLHGEYDFSEEKMSDSIGFKDTKIKDLKLP